MQIKTIIILLLLTATTVHGQTAEFSVLSYNVFLRSPTWIFSDKHDWRTERIPEFLRGYDAVVLQEAFSNKHREQILDTLRDEYPYHSDKLGEDELFSYNGGVIVLSRWPIRVQAQQVFEGCAGSDCMVKKGVVYTLIEKQGRPIHLFGLHMQAQVENAAQRVAQFPQIRSFIDAQKASADELLLVAGDFNVNYFTDSQDLEYTRLTQKVGLVLEATKLSPSYHGLSNVLAQEGVTERLDYVFYSARHLKPVSSSNEVLYFREGKHDLSDHHPVVGRFTLSNQDD